MALELLAERGEARLVEVAEGLDVSRATAFRILTTLMDHGYVEHQPNRPTYSLGRAVGSLARQVEGPTVERLARPAMVTLRNRTGETVNLVTVDRGRVIYVATLESRHGLRMSTPIGMEAPTYATAVGKAILAAGDDPRALLPPEPYPTLTPQTRTTWRALSTDLDQVREVGYAIEDAESEPHAYCIGAAIVRAPGRPVAALSVSGLADRLRKDATEIGALLRDLCMAISDELRAERTAGSRAAQS
jgi:DNA-binding IclR family transcriptional regulator